MDAIKAELAALRTRVAQLEAKVETETSKRILLEEEVARLKEAQPQLSTSLSKKGSFIRLEKKRSDTDTQDLSSNSSSPRSSGGSPRGDLNGHEDGLSSSFGNAHVNNSSNTSSHNSSHNNLTHNTNNNTNNKNVPEKNKVFTTPPFFTVSLTCSFLFVFQFFLKTIVHNLIFMCS
jgi:hypothetical protein